MKDKNQRGKTKYISLCKAAKNSGYAQDYLSLLCRQGKLKGEKIGRNWVTTHQWLDEYQQNLISGTALKKNSVTSKKDFKEIENIKKDTEKIERIKFFESIKIVCLWLLQPCGRTELVLATSLFFLILLGGFTYAKNPQFFSDLAEQASQTKDQITYWMSGIKNNISQTPSVRDSEHSAPEISPRVAGVSTEKILEIPESNSRVSKSSTLKKFIWETPIKVTEESAKIVIDGPIKIGEIVIAAVDKTINQAVNQITDAYVFVGRGLANAYKKLANLFGSTYFGLTQLFVEQPGEKISQVPFFPSGEEKGDDVYRRLQEKTDQAELKNLKESFDILNQEINELKKVSTGKIIQQYITQEIVREIIKEQKGEQGLAGPQGLTGATGPQGLSGIGTTIVQGGDAYLSGGNTWTGGNIFESHSLMNSLGVSHNTSIGDNLFVGGTTTLGTKATDDLNVQASSNFFSPLTVTNSITQSDGQVTFGGNVDATAGLDVTGADLTVGGTNFVVDVATGDTTIAGSLSVAGAQTYFGPASFESDSDTAAALLVNQKGAGNIVQFQDGGTDIFTIADNGQTTITGNVDATSGLDITGITTLGDGGTANYAQFSATGDLTFFDNNDGALITGPGATGMTLTNAAGDLTISTTSSGQLNITTTGTDDIVLTSGKDVVISTTAFDLNNTGPITLGTAASEQDITFKTQNFDVDSTGTITIDGTNFTYNPSGTYEVTPGSTYTVDSTGAVSIDSDASSTLSGAGINITSDGSNAVTLTYATTGGTFQLTDGTTRIEFADTGAGIIGDDGATTQIDGSTITLSGNSVITGTIQATTTTDVDIATANATAADIDIGTSAQANTISIGTSNAGATLELASADWGISTTGAMTGIGAITNSGDLTITPSGGSVIFAGDLVPSVGTEDIGTVAVPWDKGYFNEINATNIIASSTDISGTIAETFTINNDNATADLENSYLRFFRGTTTPHAILFWDYANDRFDANFPLYFSGTGQIAGPGATGMTLTNAGGALALSTTGSGNLSLTSAGNTIISTNGFDLNNTGPVTIGTAASEQDITFKTQNFDVDSTGTITIDGTNFTYNPSGTYEVTPGSTYTISSTGAVSIDSVAGTTLSGAGIDLTSDGANAMTFTYEATGGTFQLIDGLSGGTTRIEFADTGAAIIGDDGATTHIDGSTITLSGNTVITGTIQAIDTTDVDIATANATAADIDIGTSAQANTITIGTANAGSTLELASADWKISETGTITNASMTSTQLTDGGTIGFDWVDGEVADTLTIDNASSVDPDALTCDVGDDNLISEHCIGDVLDDTEIQDIYVFNTSDTMSGSLSVGTTLSAGATTVTTLNTGQGANELYDMNQNVLTTSNPTFNNLILTDATEQVITFDGGDSYITVHDGFGNFNLLAGIDYDNVIKSTSGGARIEMSEAGSVDIEIYSGAVSAVGSEVASFYFDDDEFNISSANLVCTDCVGDSDVSNTLTIGNAGSVDPDALTCDVGDDGLISEDCIGDVLDSSEIQDIYVFNTSDTMSGTLTTNGLILSNDNITGVNQLEIADPGEGIVWKTGASGDMSLYIVDDASDNILYTNAHLKTNGNLTITGNNLYDSGGDSFWETSGYATNKTVSGISSAGTISYANISLPSTQLTDGGTIGFDWVNDEVSDTLTIGNAGSVDPDALSCDVGDDNLISEHCIGDVLDSSEIQDIYVFNTGDTMTGDLQMNKAIHFQTSDSNNAAHSYAIFQEDGAWVSPYPDLRIAYHTGIKIGAHTSFGGTRFYSNSDMATELFSVGDGDNHVRVANNLYVTSALTAATLNTGQGANELYDMNQNVLTTSNPTFNRVYISDYGYALGGFHVGGTSDPGTDNLIVDGNINVVNGHLYVESASATTYLYSTNTYLGGGSGDTIHTRGNVVNIGANSSGQDADLRIINYTANALSEGIKFYEGTTRMGEIGCEDTTWLRINQETAKNIYTPRYIRADGGFFIDGTTYGLSGTGALQALAGSVGEAEIAQNTLDDSEIQDNSLTAGSLAANSVGDSELIDEIYLPSGVRIGADAANNEFDDASGGTGSTAMYIGNQRITTENIDTDTWITTQTCGTDYALQSVGKTSKTCINKVDYSDVAYDVSCTNCLTSTEVASADLAYNLSCTGCVAETEIAQNTLDDSEIQDNSLTAGSLAPNACGNSELIASPTVTNLYATDVFASSWLRNDGANEGLYNSATTSHFYSGDTSYWVLDSDHGLEFRNAHEGTITGRVYWDGTAGSNNFGLLTPDGSWGLRLSNTDAQFYHPLTATTGTFSGALSSTTLNTGQGANELYDMNQNVLTTSSPTFTKLTLSQATGTAPLTVSSTTKVTNLNADLLDNKSSGSFLRSDADDSFSGELVSTTRDEGIFGLYVSTLTDHVWSMGAGYKISATGADFGNLYGMAYCHTNNANCKAGLGHQIEFVSNGTVGAAIGFAGGIWTSGGITGTTLNTGQGANELYDMNQNVLTNSAVAFATVDTGYGANELYDMNQHVLTNSAVAFATVDTGYGANELYDMNQHVLTTSNVDFGDIYASGGDVSVASGDNYYKYTMWGEGDSQFGVGMYSAQTYGGLNDYAMTFTMSNNANRGWLWRDTSDAASDGAMSLTTAGILTVKHLDVEDNIAGYAARIVNDGNSTTRGGVDIQCGADNAAGTNYAMRFDDGDGTIQGYITFTSGTVTYGAFTANHDVSVPEEYNENGYPYGTLVCIKSTRTDEDQSRKVLYDVEACNESYSKKVLGAYAGKYDDQDNLHQVYVLGDGHILVNNQGGDIEIGDPITTSSAEGIGMKTNDSGMIIGYAQEDYIFTSQDDIKLLAVQYGLSSYSGELARDLNVQQSPSGQIVQIDIKSELSSLGLIVNEYGVLEVDTLKAKKVVTEEFEIRDKATDEIWCTWIENGEWERVKSPCSELSNLPPESDPAPESEPESEPDLPSDVSAVALAEGETLAEEEAEEPAIEPDESILDSDSMPTLTLEPDLDELNVCDLEHIDLCDTQEKCEGVSLYWHNDVCNLETQVIAEYTDETAIN
jgi:hypothetical protein